MIMMVGAEPDYVVRLRVIPVVSVGLFFSANQTRLWDDRTFLHLPPKLHLGLMLFWIVGPPPASVSGQRFVTVTRRTRFIVSRKALNALGVFAVSQIATAIVEFGQRQDLGAIYTSLRGFFYRWEDFFRHKLPSTPQAVDMQRLLSEPVRIGMTPGHNGC